MGGAEGYRVERDLEGAETARGGDVIFTESEQEI
jgi:hypothetical protein